MLYCGSPGRSVSHRRLLPSYYTFSCVGWVHGGQSRRQKMFLGRNFSYRGIHAFVLQALEMDDMMEDEDEDGAGEGDGEYGEDDDDDEDPDYVPPAEGEQPAECKQN